MSPLGPTLLGEEDVKANVPSRRNPTVDIPFASSRPGTWVAAAVTLGVEVIACVSMYGLIEEPTDASMHRSLSDVSAVFSDPTYKDLVLLGGDFNVGSGLADPVTRKRSKRVLDRIRAYDLIDVLARWKKKHGLPGLPDCPCGDICHHTLTRLTPNEKGANRPWEERQNQVDYLFASEELARRVHDVVEISPLEWEVYSDHRPIIVSLRA
jgi:endonuclease/exonuclease/phosphatase family metal-dependent hydrolase